jgi:hypothetical protein
MDQRAHTIADAKKGGLVPIKVIRTVVEFRTKIAVEISDGAFEDDLRR